MLYASEQIHLSPGFLWIPDLSQYDPLFILVIVTTLVMMVQQKFMTPMTQTEGPGFQKYLGYFFPLMMAFLLWRFPAGLWLYYLLTTVAQVGQQYFVNWEMARAGGGTVSMEIDDDLLQDDADEDQGEKKSDGEVDTADGD
jgi:membrane protein insertase Oxa1/YidC/SpoIIIJ